MNEEREKRINQYKRTIGLRVKSFRQNHDLTQATLAELLDVSHRQISQIEQGVSFPSLGLLIEIGRMLQEPIESFISDVPIEIPNDDFDKLRTIFTALSEDSRRSLERIAAEILKLERCLQSP